MGILREIPPTAGWPIYAREILAAISGAGGSLEGEFKSYLNAAYARLTCSGTAAFYYILSALKKLSPKKNVIIPSFACPLLPLAVKRAGLSSVICDINKEGFDYDPSQLKEITSRNKDILSIVAVHLAGLPLEFEAIEEISQENKIFVIEDCAQSLGARYKGRLTGSLAEFSFFSLCRGKGLTIYEGGLAVARNKEQAALIDETIRELSNNDRAAEALKVFELLGYWLFYRPQAFWFVWRLPQIFWEMRRQPLRACAEYFDPQFPTHRVCAFRKRLGRTLFARIETEISRQREKANWYIEELKDIPGIQPIVEHKGARATYPYLVLLFDSAARRKKARCLLKNLGLGVSEVYSGEINSFGYLKEVLDKRVFPHGRDFAARSLSLSTSSFLKEKQMCRIIELLKRL